MIRTTMRIGCAVGALLVSGFVAPLESGPPAPSSMPPGCGNCETHWLFGNPWHDFHGSCNVSSGFTGCHSDGQNGECGALHSGCSFTLSPEQMNEVSEAIRVGSVGDFLRVTGQVNVAFNSSRQAFQIEGCEGAIALHVPIALFGGVQATD